MQSRELRKKWFSEFLEGSNNEITSDKVIGFHSGTHTFDRVTNVVMEREGV